MDESENTVQAYAYDGSGVPHRVCEQLISSKARYSLWVARHDRRMHTVAVLKQRERQIKTLRAVAVEQIHRAALVRYFRDQGIVGTARDQILREFYGVLDTQQSAIEEHKSYLLAASSQLCSLELLEMTNDRRGLAMLRRYEIAYGQFFAMFCDRARAVQNGTPYLLSSLLPEVKTTAQSLRVEILSGQLLPLQPFALRSVAAR
jgi:hypothetical protein